MKDDIKKAGDSLKVLFDKLMPEESQGYVGLFSGWEQIVGPEASLHVVLVDVLNGSLILEVDHPGWIQRMRFRQEGILAEINSRYPELEIARMRISVGKNARQDKKPSDINPIHDVVEKTSDEPEKTPRIASDSKSAKEDTSFREKLEKFRRLGDP